MLYLVILLASALFVHLDAATVTLNTQDQSLTQPAQQPFKIVATVHNGDRSTSNLTLKGLEQLRVLGQQRSNNVTMVNGNYQSTVSYVYTVEAMQPGSYTIGPATITQQGQSINSNTLNINVTQPTPQQQAAQAKAAGSLSLKLSSNKNKIVIGEPIELVAAVCSSRQISEAAMGNLEAPGFTVKETGAPVQRIESINGVQHIIIEKKYSLTPHKAGIFSLGPIHTDLAVAMPRKAQSHNGFFDESFFNDFFGTRAEVVHLQSNPLSINVLPLPTENIDAVGLFTSYQASISAHEAAINEPITLSLDLEGIADFDQINVPRLVLPQGVKHYESKNETIVPHKSSPHNGKKHFEFIIQANTMGPITIPSQVFTYYDYQAQQIKTVQTNALQVVIASQANTQQAVTSTPMHNTEKAAPVLPVMQPPEQKKPLQGQEIPMVPWWLFILCLTIPMLFVAKPIIALGKTLTTKILLKQTNRYASSENALKSAIAHNNLLGVYDFFMNYIAIQMDISTQNLNLDEVEKYCSTRGLPQEKTDSFITFLGQCSSSKYGQNNIQKAAQEALLKKAHYWFLTLKS